MDCFQDFCLVCDRDSPDGPYCSQQCKLADVERANSSPCSPTSSTTSKARQQDMPAYDTLATRRPGSSYFMWNPTLQSQPEAEEERRLTPSSSRTSLSSATSTSSMTRCGISTRDKQQLQEYFNSFDQAKAAKRRSSLR